jgi:CcmD family protein
MRRFLLVAMLLTSGLGLAAQQPVDDRPRDPTAVTKGTATSGQSQPPSPAQEGFVPIDQIQKKEEIPAAPLLLSAYAFAWIAIFAFVWSIWQRLGKVEREIAEVTRRVAAGGRRP